MYKVELTEEEKNALFGLLDLAVRAEGLRAAQAAVYLHNKIEAGKVQEEKKE